uniref:Type II toxin-antitoxin system RelE/ParE family toxin n=1 Tax=Desulfobacca acetoxidans TaxID=60893 RepID=A0A7V4G8M9_9BACT
MSYVLRLTKRAVKDLERLDLTTARRIRRRLQELASDPLDHFLSYSLEMERDKRSSRVGDWRILYQVKESENLIEVLAIAPRGRAYRKL